MTIRFGVIGLSRGKSFVRVCHAAQGAEVAALYDIDEERVAEAAAEIGATPYSDFDAFLNADLEVIVVASPVPFHAEQAIAALKAGKHVLSEVAPCETMEDAHALVRAVRESDAIYMMAENYRYLDEVELLKRMNDDGRFGEAYYFEGEYLHDCKDLWFDSQGSRTWRGTGGDKYVYCTHSLGPLLYITGERVTTVSAMAVPGGKFGPGPQKKPTTVLMNLLTDKGNVMRLRFDSTSPRPHQMAYYAVQGTKGSFESWRGNGDTSKVWLEDTHQPSRVTSDGAEWHPVSDFAETYIPERLAVPPEARLGGHGTSEYWMLKDFMAAVRGEIAPPIDIYTSLDYGIPGILALESVRALGAPVEVPDPRSFPAS